MPVTDPIADMLTRIRNANMAFHEEVEIPYSKLKWEIAKILRDEGYIKACFWNPKGKKKPPIKIMLKYGPNGERVIHGLERISKPGRRIYGGVDQIPRTLGGLGITIVSTSRGVMVDRECRRKRIGGEILCAVW
ncbi:MAG: 30S ribosomal protein S8 [Candidatus Hydrogenedentota bacterium]|jgi:small subunit ribosomal protein S8|uniref:Small ribosomal subunit protein uS8 n=1 Tax=Sumerlaea chitinivorans TaxID=2250252 RepID=A0A2Z4Y2W1_SUMC1|nr:SSU ribosomal protein S8p (S15Ae) [Candidatus Sumerlaea chitinivorans]MCX7963639.1 30S ribosomal protein S8 [Candidatus Sumerlaea chitinivorans]RMH25894.1 MAG: 30S ribosomal protein S8 [Candidatus Hydrogenedentota bacterium]GIX45334.1 MAG: 30S ribosomal protein S8 [Candidatus Sumerlaea sp.]